MMALAARTGPTWPSAASLPADRALSPIELGLLFPEFYGKPGRYVEQVICTLSGKLDRARLGKALRLLVNRHEILRTRYVRAPGGPRAVVRRSALAPVRLIDVSQRAAPEAAARALIASDAGRHFDVGRNLSDCALYRLGPDRHLFAWTYHHVLADSWTLRFLQDQLIRIYESLGASCPGPALTLSPAVGYSDYAGWVAQADPQPVLDQWCAWLRGDAEEGRGAPAAMAGPLGGAGPDPAQRCEIRICLDGTARANLELARRQHRVSANVVLLAMWGLAGACGGHRQAGLLGCVVFGRGVPVKGITEIAGVCANVVPARIATAGPLGAFLAELQHRLLAANGLAHLALGDVLAAAALQREQMHSVVNFTIDRASIAAVVPDREGPSVSDLRYVQASDYPAYLDIEISAQDVTITLNFAPALRSFDAAQLTADCAALLAAMARPEPADMGALLAELAPKPEVLAADFDWHLAGKP